VSSPISGTDGSFSVTIPANASSRTVTLAYREHLGDLEPVAVQTLNLTVRAGIRLSISPRVARAGTRIHFTGRLLGGPVPAGGKPIVLEARAGRGGWIKFNVVRSSRSGALRASYRFRFPGPVHYQFRAVSEAEADYPYAPGSSNVVRVLER
jgi:hypothetical protein